MTYRIETYRVGHCTDHWVVGPGGFMVNVEFLDQAEQIADRLNEQTAEIERLRALIVEGA